MLRNRAGGAKRKTECWGLKGERRADTWIDAACIDPRWWSWDSVPSGQAGRRRPQQVNDEKTETKRSEGKATEEQEKYQKVETGGGRARLCVCQSELRRWEGLRCRAFPAFPSSLLPPPLDPLLASSKPRGSLKAAIAEIFTYKVNHLKLFRLRYSAVWLQPDLRSHQRLTSRAGRGGFAGGGGLSGSQEPRWLNTASICHPSSDVSSSKALDAEDDGGTLWLKTTSYAPHKQTGEVDPYY